MNDTYYTLGNFTLGSGSCGFGPSFDTEEQMEQIVKNVDGQHIYTSLIEYGDVVLKQNPTLSNGDVKISLDNGSFVDLVTLPVVISGYKIDIQLAQAETNCSQLQIIFKDQSPIPEWNDKVLNISTSQMDYNNITAIGANLTEINGIELSAATLPLKSIEVNNTNGNAVSLNSTNGDAISAISTTGNAFYLSGASDKHDIVAREIGVIDTSNLATSAQAFAIQSAVNAIPIDNNGITVSASNFIPTDLSPLTSGVSYLINQVDNTIYGLSAINHNVLITSSAPVDLGPVTSAINYIISDLDNPLYGLSAINTNVTVTNTNVIETSAITSQINNITSQITISGGNINARVSDKGVLNDISVTDILGSDVDGMSMNDALTKILSWAIGKIDVNGSVFTYYKQDNSTSAFALSGSDVNRIRL